MNEAARNQLPKFVQERWDGTPSQRTQKIPENIVADLTGIESSEALVFSASDDDHLSVNDFQQAMNVVQSIEEEERVMEWFLNHVGKKFLQHVFLSFFYGNHPRTQKVRRQIEHAFRVHYRIFTAKISSEELVNFVVTDMIDSAHALTPELRQALKNAVLNYEKELESDRKDVGNKLLPEFKSSFLRDMNFWLQKGIVHGIDPLWLKEKIDRLRGGVFSPNEALAEIRGVGFFHAIHNEVFFNKVRTKKDRERNFRHEVFHYLSYDGEQIGIGSGNKYFWLREAITESLACAQFFGINDRAVTSSTVLSYGAGSEEGAYSEYRAILNGLLATLKRKQVMLPEVREDVPLEQLFLNAYFADGREKKAVHWAKCVQYVNRLVGRKDFLRSFDRLVQWCDPLTKGSGVIDLALLPGSIGKIQLRPDALRIVMAEEPMDRLFWLCEVASVCKRMTAEDKVSIMLRNRKLKKLFDEQGLRNSADFFQESSLFLLQETV